MNSEAGDIKQSAHAWIDQLSKEQMLAVAPLLQTLSGVLALSTRSEPTQELPRQGLDKPAATSESYLTIENQLERALETKDPQALRDSVSACLKGVRSKRICLLTGQAIAEGGIDRTNLTKSPGLATADSTTGLPGRLMFERTVSNAIAEGKDAMVVLFVVERLVYINKRFGRVTGDEILLFVAQYLAQELPDSGSLSRWSGPAFAAILNPNGTAKKTEMRVRALSGKQLSKNIDSGGRSIMLPICCSCMIEPLAAETSPEMMFSKMDDFLSAHITD